MIRYVLLYHFSFFLLLTTTIPIISTKQDATINNVGTVVNSFATNPKPKIAIAAIISTTIYSFHYGSFVQKSGSAVRLPADLYHTPSSQ